MQALAVGRETVPGGSRGGKKGGQETVKAIQGNVSKTSTDFTIGAIP